MISAESEVSMGSSHFQQRSSDISTGRNEVKWCELTDPDLNCSLCWEDLSQFKQSCFPDSGSDSCTWGSDPGWEHSPGGQGATTALGQLGQAGLQPGLTANTLSHICSSSCQGVLCTELNTRFSTDFSGCWKCIKLLAWMSTTLTLM